MSFSPQPLPSNSTTMQIVDAFNSNFQLLAKAINDIQDKQDQILERTKKKASIAGLTETLNFNGSLSGEILTLTLVGGSVIEKTEVP